MGLKKLRDYIILKIASLCHRKEERSFHTEDHQSIVCTRCSSIYIGFLLTFIFLLAYGFYYSRISILYSLFLLIPISIDGLSQAFEVRESTNYLRIFTGLLLGSSFSLLLGKSLQNNLNLFAKEIFTLPSWHLLGLLGTAFLILSYISRKSTPKSIYLIDSLTFVGYINMMVLFVVAILTTLTKYSGMLIS